MTKNSMSANPWLRVWFPYVFQRMPHDKIKWVFLPLNRDYKTIGFIPSNNPDDGNWIHYSEFYDNTIAFKSDPSKFIDVWVHQDVDRFWLYEEDTDSQKTYWERLKKLTTLVKILGKSDYTFGIAAPQKAKASQP